MDPQRSTGCFKGLASLLVELRDAGVEQPLSWLAEQGVRIGFEAGAPVEVNGRQVATLTVAGAEDIDNPLAWAEHGGVCEGCGCSDDAACIEGCSWARANLCTRCAYLPVVDAVRDGLAPDLAHGELSVMLLISGRVTIRARPAMSLSSSPAAVHRALPGALPAGEHAAPAGGGETLFETPSDAGAGMSSPATRPALPHGEGATPSSTPAGTPAPAGVTFSRAHDDLPPAAEVEERVRRLLIALAARAEEGADLLDDDDEGDVDDALEAVFELTDDLRELAALWRAAEATT